jgi:hypothetical protein
MIVGAGPYSHGLTVRWFWSIAALTVSVLLVGCDGAICSYEGGVLVVAWPSKESPRPDWLHGFVLSKDGLVWCDYVCEP